MFWRVAFHSSTSGAPQFHEFWFLQVILSMSYTQTESSSVSLHSSNKKQFSFRYLFPKSCFSVDQPPEWMLSDQYKNFKPFIKLYLLHILTSLNYILQSSTLSGSWAFYWVNNNVRSLTVTYEKKQLISVSRCHIFIIIIIIDIFTQSH